MSERGRMGWVPGWMRWWQGGAIVHYQVVYRSVVSSTRVVVGVGGMSEMLDWMVPAVF